MGPDDVLEVIDALLAHGARCWLDGGWGIDALLGRQTREHGDVDLVLPRSAVPTALEVLGSRGFSVLRDWLPTSIALTDGRGREVDLHPVDPLPGGGGAQLLPDGTVWHYRDPVFGTVSGRAVLCCSADEQVAMHRGYPPREIDRRDVAALADRFDVEIPSELR